MSNSDDKTTDKTTDPTNEIAESTNKTEESADKTLKESRYLENLRAILDGARQEYQIQTIDWRNAQLAHLKNYMWAAATLFAFESSLALGITYPGKGISLPWDVEPSRLFHFFAIAAICSCAAAFLYALDSCRGRGTIDPPSDQFWTSVADIAWDEKTGEKPTGTVLVTMITDLEKACRKHQKQGGKKSTKLRIISVALIISAVLTVLFIIPW